MTAKDYSARIINSSEVYPGLYRVTYKVWPRGKCACLGQKITTDFSYDPTSDDVINSFKENNL